MDDFRRPPVNRSPQPQPLKQPLKPGHRTSITPDGPDSMGSLSETPTQNTPAPQPIENPANVTNTPKRSKKKNLLIILGALLIVALAAMGALYVWYSMQLGAVNSSDTTKRVVTIESGSTPKVIATQLESEGVIKDSEAFLLYTRIRGVQNNLQAGTYRLSPSETTPEIVEHLSKGKVDTFNITFLPGNRLSDNRNALIKAGYTEKEVDAALNKQYRSPLFDGKPATADLEGYIYGETYTFGTDTSVEAILEYTFTLFNEVIVKNDLKNRFAQHGLSLYEGITLASIVQKEAGSTPDDMAQISQVFHTRLKQGMELGSDPTYQYAADKMGVPRDTKLQSPYNTRINPGLPPGPIAAPGEKALIATASPASGNYVYFLSGDDNVTYFSRTLQEHEANIRNHCQQKCQIL